MSRYWVVTESFETAVGESTIPAAVNNSLVRPTVYDLFIWMHHFAAKDNPSKIHSLLKIKLHNAYFIFFSVVDYAHESTGFLTWHHLFLLWFEREIQVATSDPTFMFSYWDWTDSNEREAYFTSDRLGISAQLFAERPTYCWKTRGNNTEIFNPTVSSNQQLRRCPDPIACSKENTLWPVSEDVIQALEIPIYDTVSNREFSFRSFLEGFKPVSSCDDIILCTNSSAEGAIERTLNTAVSLNSYAACLLTFWRTFLQVHVLLGLGKTVDENSVPFEIRGVMADVAASPNDPIYINHHTMIDCIFDVWLKCNYTRLYPFIS